MTRKLITCRRCGEGGLIWKATKAGKWYLTYEEPAKVRGETGRVIKTFYPAHRCPA